MIAGYYFITDAALSRKGNETDVRAAADAGVGIIQYREKHADTVRMLAEARKLRTLCAGALFVVNDRIDVALAAEADGVHLGQGDMPYRDARRLLGGKRIIGLTAHSAAEARAAEEAGADYIGLAPIFATATKRDAGAPAGVALVRQVRSVVRIPIVAIGGITLENAPAVIAAGADAVCAISAVVAREDAADRIRRFQALFEGQNKGTVRASGRRK